MTEQERERIFGLFESALEDLDEEEYDAALAKAAQMRQAGFSGAFEIEALVWRARADLERALSVLRESPQQVFALQLLLGSTLCDSGRHEEALAVYERARTLGDCDPEALCLNLAVTLSRMGRYEDALRECPQDAGEMREACQAVRVGLLSLLGRHSEAAALARQALRADTPARDSAPFWYALALDAWHSRANRAETLALGLRALRSQPNHEDTARLFYDALGNDSQRYRLMAHGRWHEEVDGYLPHFYRTFYLEAPDLETAQHLAAGQEPEPVRASMTWEQIEEMGPFPSGVGVIAVSGHLFYHPAS